MKRALAILSFLIPACVWGQVLPRPSETVHRKGAYRWTSEPETVLAHVRRDHRPLGILPESQLYVKGLGDGREDLLWSIDVK